MEITRSIVSERDRALLNGDYATYHAQASRRIHTLRKRLKVTTPRGRKYTPKDPVTADNVASNAEWVQLLLASAERSWAHAMAMKSSQSPENTQKPLPASTKRQIVSRLRRSVSYAENLVTVLKDRSTSTAQSEALEAKAYLFMLKGTLDFEKSRWKSCLQNYSLVHLVYTTIGSEARTDVYKDLVSATVDPSLRYAAYQLKMSRTKPVKEIVLENFPSEEREVYSALTNLDAHVFDQHDESKQTTDGAKDAPSHITWRKMKVKLEDAAISQALGIARKREIVLEDNYKTFSGGEMDLSTLAAAYDDVITAHQDAADATKTAIDELAAEGVDPGDSRMQGLQITRTAVNYTVIEWRVGRNRILCGAQDGLTFQAETHRQSNKPGKNGKPRPIKLESTGRKLARLRERTALYDSILQSLDSVKELPGVIADESFVDELDFKRSYFRALKCLAVGRSHTIKGATVNGLALYARAVTLLDNVLHSSSASESPSQSAPKLSVSPSAISSTKAHLSSLVTQLRALADLQSLTTATQPSATASSTTKKTFKRPLIETLHQNTYHSTVDLTNLVNYPPKLQPIPVKPLFFDLAFSYIQYPGHEKKLGGGGGGGDGDVNGTGKRGVGAVADEKTEISQDGRGEAEKPAPAKKSWFGFGR